MDRPDVAASSPTERGALPCSDGLSLDDLRLLTVDEVAELLRCSARTVRRRVAEGSVPVVRVGPALLFRSDDVAQLLKSRLAGEIQRHL